VPHAQHPGRGLRRTKPITGFEPFEPFELETCHLTCGGMLPHRGGGGGGLDRNRVSISNFLAMKFTTLHDLYW